VSISSYQIFFLAYILFLTLIYAKVKIQILGVHVLLLPGFTPPLYRAQLPQILETLSSFHEKLVTHCNNYVTRDMLYFCFQFYHSAKDVIYYFIRSD